MLDPISRYLVESVLSHSGRNSRGPLLLMYHGTTAGAARPDSRYSIEASRFEEHLDLLQRFGWQTVCVRDLASADLLSDKTVAITFDDGYADNYAGAFLPLAERGMKATWFIVTGIVGGHAHWMGQAGAQTAILSARHLSEMAEAGMEIGSHTRTHPDLTVLSGNQLDDEIGASKRELEDLLGRPVGSFAYPYGRFNDQAVQSVAQAEYGFACSVRPGWLRSDPDPYRLRRVTIFRDETLGSFARKLVFADNDVSWNKLTRYGLSRVAARLKPRGVTGWPG